MIFKPKLPAYPRILLPTEKIEEAKNIRYSIPRGDLMGKEYRSIYLALPYLTMGIIYNLLIITKNKTHYIQTLIDYHSQE